MADPTATPTLENQVLIISEQIGSLTDKLNDLKNEVIVLRNRCNNALMVVERFGQDLVATKAEKTKPQPVQRPKRKKR